MSRPRASSARSLEPLPPRKKWRAITIATLALLPAYLSIVVGLVAVASDRPDAPPAGPAIAFGLGLLPFVFVALAFLSSHPRAPGAAAKAMALSLLVGIPVAAIFQFLWVWNDLLVAYVFLGGTRQNRVLTIALANLVGGRGENWQLLTAAAFISMALPLIVFFALQKYFVRGLTAGAVKG